MLVVAFYTLETPYAEEVKHLIESCRFHNLDVHVEAYPNQGRWVWNAALKPFFIRDMLKRFHNQNLLYLDADAVVIKPPSEPPGDIGVHFLDDKELLSGTIFLKNNAKVRRLVEDWCDEQLLNRSEWDQRVLQRILPRHALEVTNLPRAYCKIFDKPGEAVIQQNQASRRFKHVVERIVDIPEVVGNMRIRRESDGSYVLTRHHAEAEAFLNKHCIKAKGELKWHPRPKSDHKIEELAPLFKDKKCYVVGKGPSLDRLTALDFQDPTAPVIAINEAIHKVEELGLVNPVFVLVKDVGLGATCKPKKAKVIATLGNKDWYADCETYIFQPKPPEVLSALAAVAIGKSLGSKSFVFVSFDACTNKDTSYAKSVGYESTRGGDPGRFLSHRPKIMKALTGYNAEWVTPKGPD
jgi:hypothetical protein